MGTLTINSGKFWDLIEAAMSNYPSYPIQVSDIFFIKLDFERKPKPFEEKQIQFSGQVFVLPKNEQGKLQVQVRLNSLEDSSVTIAMEAVGLFDYLETTDQENLDRLTNYINNQALPLIWMQFKNYIKIISTSMGLGEIQLPVPDVFSVTRDEMFPKVGAVE